MQSDNSANFVIEKTIYTGYLDVLEFTATASDQCYFDYFKTREKSLYDLNLIPIADIVLRRRIVEYFFHSMNPARYTPESFNVFCLRTVKRLLKNIPQVFHLSYHSFLRLDFCYGTKGIFNQEMRAFFSCFRSYCNLKDHEENPFDSDIWPLSRFALSYERSSGLRIANIFFSNINNPKNKYLVKKYIEHALLNTGKTLSSIYGNLSALRIILNSTPKPYQEWTADDATEVVNTLHRIYTKKSSLISRLSTLFDFTNYLLIHDYIQTSPIKTFRNLLHNYEYERKLTSVSQSVIAQLFNVLDQIEDERLVLCFLILYCVGARISEVCSLRPDCLEKTEHGAFIKYYSIKMKKDVYNVIPESLYNRINEYRKCRVGKEYLFAAKRTERAISTSFFSQKFNEAIQKFNIRNPDGTQYRFKAHSFRHTIAVEMRERNIPLQFIQEQLHHSSLDMTMAYVEYIDRTKIRKMNEFIINSSGETSTLVPPSMQQNNQNDDAYIDYMRQFLNAQMLPNGICARPVKIGKCPHANDCLFCSEFRTSRIHLETHRQHLQRTNDYILWAEENGFLPQVESHKRIKEKLENIIEQLENMNDT